MYVAAPNGTMVTAIARGRRGKAGEDAPMMEALDAWELRWIAQELPTLDAAWLPPSSLDPAVKVVDEHDVYVLTRSDRINLKVRHRGTRSSSRACSNEETMGSSDGALNSTCRWLPDRNASATCWS